MPRKTYRPKNRFVVKSKLGESEFATLAWLYLQGMSAPQARAAYAAMDHPSAENPPSEKTISDIFRRIGTYLFYRLFEPAIHIAAPELTRLRAHDADLYKEEIIIVAEDMVRGALEFLSYEDFSTMCDSRPVLGDRDAIAMEIRKLSASRQGIKSDPRADIGLSQMKVVISTRMGRGLSDDEQVNLMLKTLLDWLLFEPLDEHGNPNQLFRDVAPKFPYGNFGLPDPGYVQKKKAKE